MSTPTDKSKNKLPEATGSKSSRPSKTACLNKSSKNIKPIKKKVNCLPKKKTKNKRPPRVWRHESKVFDEEQSKCTGNPELSKELAELQHPYQFFKYFFDDELIHKIADQSSLYSTQKNPAKPKTLTKRDIEKYLGILIFSSVKN